MDILYKCSTLYLVVCTEIDSAWHREGECAQLLRHLQKVE